METIWLTLVRLESKQWRCFAAAASYLRVDAASQTPSYESQHPAERSHFEDRVGLLRDGIRARRPKRLKRLAASARRNNW